MQNKENKLREIPSNQIKNEELLHMVEVLRKEKTHLEMQVKMENNKKKSQKRTRIKMIELIISRCLSIP